jgi:hypothetical protein
MLQGKGHETAEVTFSSSGLLKLLKARIMPVLKGMGLEFFPIEGTHLGVVFCNVVFASNRETLFLVVKAGEIDFGTQGAEVMKPKVDFCQLMRDTYLVRLPIFSIADKGKLYKSRLCLKN